VADTPASRLVYAGGCPDCAQRQVELPPPLPAVGDDFDWRVRDYDGFRRFMLEELAARFPERPAFTAADPEVALVEVLAAVLDRLSDLLDRVTAEATLGTAQRPDSVRKLLALVGYDAVGRAWAAGLIAADPDADAAAAAAELDSRWGTRPDEMEEARRAGPLAIADGTRMAPWPTTPPAWRRIRWCCGRRPPPCGAARGTWSRWR
jgi:hypothetical protein